VVTSRSVLEHLRGNERFFSEAFRVLRPGGVMIHTFPCKFAPFALINQALPNAVSKRVLYFFIEEARGYSGFPAYYEKCYPSAVRRLVKETGFEEEELAISFSQSAYFSVMTPAYLLSRAYEALVQAIGADNLCAFILLRARKTAAPDESRNGSRNRIAASPPFIGAG
jgi:2-polyprenyl-6-hydroxyphenyl methylase/3-demethylubiquinone-9 3-methyltransferase